MALFSQLNDFAPLFHLLDDYDVHRSCRPKQRVTPVRSFSPRFDVYEANDGYHLNGELPGVDQNNIEIEFTDPHTLVVKGRAERTYATSHAQPPVAEDAPRAKSRQPTVEDEDDASDSASVSSSASASKQAVAPQPAERSYKFWASERSVGEFHRAFTFPTRVDQDAVKASLKDGLLSVVVPKEPAPKLKKIRVE
ncbi:heat shock Hsp30-like protein [Aspergillus ambiguus]|uniref:Hsp20/alpha crystallin family protein n=1 Tax=Aspergillus ambiguus TaxID=176160 RepID=UPI003CCD48AE